MRVRETYYEWTRNSRQLVFAVVFVALVLLATVLVNRWQRHETCADLDAQLATALAGSTATAYEAGARQAHADLSAQAGCKEGE